jgi:thioredoxin reductase/ferredoxin/pSer/pThr/pTyr-binding forkhead associated (FHA) protein
MSDAPTILPDGTMVLKNPVELPETLDVLIVGAGPAGTGAAFRARELGLSALVVEMDDVLAKIRDFPKEKDILPNYGKADTMGFPDTGDLLRSLHFEPVDPETLHSRWKALYAEHSVPVKVGVELTALEEADGCWTVQLRNRNLRADETVRARTVVLALGRGVPRRFDIPGNLDDIAYRLSDPNDYVGDPVLVVGGGTSAAEAVIAISNAKAKAEDRAGVYWAYRGDSMPRVNSALSDAFFEAYLGNGNITYCKRSDPVAVVTAEDKKEYLAVRVDRKLIEGRPNEASHLEFPKHRVVACIGEEFPERFLDGLRVPLAVGGRPKKKRALVSSELESGRAGIFVIGDTLSDYHLTTGDFGDPSGNEVVERTGNIKSGLLDGVRVIEVIRQRLSGTSGGPVVVPVTPAAQSAAAAVEDRKPAAVGAETDFTIRALTSGDAAAVPEERVAAYLVALLPDDSKGESHPVRENQSVTLGRSEGDIRFPQDTWLSPRHASLASAADGFLLRDDGGQTGVYLRLAAGRALAVPPGSYVRVGTHFLRFVVQDGKAIVENRTWEGQLVGTHPVSAAVMTLGRTIADVEIDPEDLTISKRHLSVQFVEGKLLVADAGSTNGSYLKVNGSVPVQDGDEIRLGQQRLRLEIVKEEARQAQQRMEQSGTITFRAMAPAAPAPPTPAGPAPSVPAAPARAAAPGECEIVFANLDRAVVVDPEYSILEAAEENDIEMACDCRGGTCGADPVRILAGIENVSEVEPLEAEWLKKFGFEAPECRFACMARVSGNVTVEILSKKK